MTPSDHAPKSPLALLSKSGAFPKAARVRQRREFLTIQKRGLRVHTGCFTVVAFTSQNSTRARLGCVVSKRVGNAVVRSRVRRLLRECFRRLQHHLSTVDFVVIAKPQASQRALNGLEDVAVDLIPAILKADKRAAQRYKGKL